MYTYPIIDRQSQAGDNRDLDQEVGSREEAGNQQLKRLSVRRFTDSDKRVTYEDRLEEQNQEEAQSRL